MRLKEGSVAVVTGAGRGIGREIALAFAREGSDLVLAARGEEALAETAAMLAPLGTGIRIADHVRNLSTDQQAPVPAVQNAQQAAQHIKDVLAAMDLPHAGQ